MCHFAHLLVESYLQMGSRRSFREGFSLFYLLENAKNAGQIDNYRQLNSKYRVQSGKVQN